MENGENIEKIQRKEGLFGSQKENKLINEFVSYDDRRMTDVCCLLIGLLFTAGVVVVPFLMRNEMTVKQLTLVSDTDGKICGVDYPKYPFLYFPNPSDIVQSSAMKSQRVCMSSCPSAGVTAMDCKSTTVVNCENGESVNFMQTKPKESLNGKVCIPVDEQARISLEKDNQLSNKYFFFMDYAVYYLRVAMAAGVAFLVLVMIQCCPGFTMHLVMFLSLMAALGLGTIFYVYHTETFLEKIIVAGVLGLIFLFTVLQIIIYRQAIKFAKIFFIQSRRFIWENCGTLLYILLFLIILAAFLFLNYLLYSYGLGIKPATFDPKSSLFYKPDKNVFIIVVSILGVYLLWGFGCILQMLGFFVSTSVHHSVYKPENECSAFCLALKLALGKHLGTIFAASFVNVFLFLPSVIYGDLRSCLGAKFYKAGCCGALFDLVRSDAISYSVLTGNPYCNSAKYCEYLWYQSMTTENIKSSLIVFKVSSGVMATASAAVGSLFVFGVIPGAIIYLNLVLGFLITAIFVQLHCQACESIRLIYLIEEQSYKRREQLLKHTTNSLNRADQLKFIKEAQIIYSNKQVAEEIATMRKSFWNIQIPTEQQKPEKKRPKRSARPSR